MGFLTAKPSRDEAATKTSKTKKSLQTLRPRPSKPSVADPPNVYYSPDRSRGPVKQQQQQQKQPSMQLAPRPSLYNVSQDHQSSGSCPNQPQHALAPQTGLQQYHSQAPIIVNQHYYFNNNNNPYPHPQPHSQPWTTTHHQTYSQPYPSAQPSQWPPQQQQISTTLGGTVDDLARDIVPLYDDVRRRFDDIMTLIDVDKLCSGGNESAMFSAQTGPPPVENTADIDRGSRGGGAGAGGLWKRGDRGDRAKTKSMAQLRQSRNETTKGNMSSSQTTASTTNYFAKVYLYANAFLPSTLPPLVLYTPTWPLICLAAQSSEQAYTNPSSSTRVSSSWLTGTKAMVIKSVPADPLRTIVLAIRGTGTASFSDWAVNLRSAPASPGGFLDDAGNLCHAGFLAVARRTAAPVAERLRALLREDEGRRRKGSGTSLVITGHSAGGAVAALLYCHMLAGNGDAASELNALTGSFKRVHCITFGAPPISLLPLAKPNRPELRNSLFLSFINEGDPVVRADKAYVRSLVDLLASPPPPQSVPHTSSSPSPADTKPSRKHRKQHKDIQQQPPHKPTWPVPVATLSNAGQLIVLRSGGARDDDSGGGSAKKKPKTVREMLDEGVVAATCREEQLRGVIWGDPVSHMMSLYAGRVEVLAVGAVTTRKR